MIQIEILESPDINLLSTFKFFQNELYLGRNSGNIHIEDPSLLDSHLMIEVVEKDLLVHPQKDVSSYLIDGKRASNIRKVKIGQLITIGHTKIKICGFELTEFKTKKQILDEKLAFLAENNSTRMPVIEKLAHLMK